MNINVEYKDSNGNFPKFFEKINGKKLAIMYDVNTRPFAKNIVEKIKNKCEISEIFFNDSELIPDENTIKVGKKGSTGCDYLLAVGSGTLNDSAKAISFDFGIECGVLATAPSMDGYCSVGSALMKNGVKVTYTCHSPSDVLIDLDIMTKAPPIMIASGFGDILGKYTCLTDWKLSNLLNGEEINQEAYSLMEKARSACMDAYDGLTSYQPSAVAKLTEALIIAGTSMAICKNSRPASGSEHHMSHFLEMDFIKKGKKVPLHGIKVGIGTLISVEIYNFIKGGNYLSSKQDEFNELVEKLPKVEKLKNMLIGMKAPVKMSDIGVEKDVMEKMIENAWTVRDRYTVLTLVHDLNLTEKVKPLIMEKYF